MLKVHRNCLKRSNYVLDSVNFSKCVGSYRVTLGRLLKLKLTNLNYLNNMNNKDILTRFSSIRDSKGYIYSKYFGKNPQEILDSIESKVTLILAKMDPNLLDSCKILLNFKISDNFMKLIKDNIDLYGNHNNLYHLLFYTLRYNLLSNDFRTKNRNKNFLIPLLLDSICTNFDEIDNKFQILSLLYNFNIFHDHFTQLMDQYLSDPVNIRFLRKNLCLVLNYFNKYTTLNPGYSLTHLSNLLSKDVLEHSPYNLNDLLAIFNHLLQTNPNLTSSCCCFQNLKLILLKINSKLSNKHSNLTNKHANLTHKHSILTHIVNLLNTFTFYSFYPYLSLLTLIDNDLLLSKLLNGLKLINDDSLININNLYLNYSLNSPLLTKFVNLSLEEIFSHFNNNISTISFFNISSSSSSGNSSNCGSSMDSSCNMDSNNCNINTMDSNNNNNNSNNDNNNNNCNNCSNNNTLKLTRKLNKLIHNIYQSNALTSLTLPNLININSFIDNFSTLTHFLTTPFNALHLNYSLKTPESSSKQSSLFTNNNVTFFNDINLGSYNIVSNNSTSNSGNGYGRNSGNNNNNNNFNISGRSKLHSEVMNTLRGMNRTLKYEQPVLNNSYSIDILVNS